MSRNTKQTDLARQILDTLPNGLGNASKNLKVYVGLRNKINAIAEEIEALKQEEIVDTKKIATLETEKADLKHEFNSYGQKLKAAGIDLGACDEEMDRQAFIADNIKLIKEASLNGGAILVLGVNEEKTFYGSYSPADAPDSVLPVYNMTSSYFEVTKLDDFYDMFTNISFSPLI